VRISLRLVSDQPLWKQPGERSGAVLFLAYLIADDIEHSGTRPGLWSEAADNGWYGVMGCPRSR
jgi:hypothetical protein